MYITKEKVESFHSAEEFLEWYNRQTLQLSSDARKEAIERGYIKK